MHSIWKAVVIGMAVLFVGISASPAVLSCPQGAKSGECAHETDSSHTKAVTVSVDASGFHPAQLHASVGKPLHVVFRRTSDQTCATAVSMPLLGVRSTPLPMNQDVEVTVRPSKAGTYAFSCPMGMVKGSIVVH